MHMHVPIYVPMHKHEASRAGLQVSSSITLYLIIALRQGLSLNQKLAVLLAAWPSSSGDLPISIPHCGGYRQPYVTLNMVAGGSSSGPHACTVSSLIYEAIF